MKAGEYVGKDGKQYAVEKPFIRATAARREGDGVLYGSSTIVHITQDHPDWPAAKAALDALIAEQYEEWVEIDALCRIKKDGTQPQYRMGVGLNDWIPLTSDCKRWPAAYRKGREVAQAEREALREQVRALVEEILSVVPLLQIARGGWLDRLQEAAKAVQL